MDFLPEWIKTVNGLIGLILTVFGAGWGAVAWADRRQKKRADEAVSSLRESGMATAHSIDRLADRLNGIEQDMDRVDARVTGLERSMETVAKREDVSMLDASLREFRGQMTAEVRALKGMTDTMYKAALAAAQNRKPEL